MKSLTEMYIELRDPVFKFLTYLCNDADLAQELTQETFYQAIMSFKRFYGASSFKTWLYAIARNTCLKEQKKRYRHQGLKLSDNHVQNVPSDKPGPLDYLIQTEQRFMINRIIKELPENYRTVLVLKEFEEWSYKDLAQVMGKTENWVRVTYFRAKQQLKEKYYEVEGGENNGNELL